MEIVLMFLGLSSQGHTCLLLIHITGHRKDKWLPQKIKGILQPVDV